MAYDKLTIYNLIKLVAEIWFYAVGIGILFLFVLTLVESFDHIYFPKGVFKIG